MIGLLAAGIALGLAGSLHCAAMCGPLTLVVRRNTWLHHAGRIGTYVTLGAAAGLAGRVIAGAGSTRLLSVVAGGSLLVAAIEQPLRRMRRSSRPARRVAAFGAVARWRSRHGRTGALAFGVLNGLLPCGLVYAAAGASVSVGDPLGSAAFMAAFGLGSIPALLAVRWVGGIARETSALRVRHAAPVALALVGALLVVRGLWPVASGHDHGAHVRAGIVQKAHHEVVKP